MKVFVTGATGWVGSAIVKELIGAGHEVLGLARSDTGASALAAAGAKVQRGSLEDLESLSTGAAGSDAVIHTAFNHDFSKIIENSAVERRAIETLGQVLEGSNRCLILTSGVALLAPGRVATEDDAPHVISPNFPRAPEEAAQSSASRGVRVSVVRLAPTVHGDGDHGFVPMLIDIARKTGASAYVGDGANVWPAVHRFDAASVYCLALARGCKEARYHAVAEEGVPFKQIAEVIGRRLNLPVVSKTPGEAAEHFGWFAMFAGMNVPTSSAKTVELLGWIPKHKRLIEDLDQPYYFK